MILNKAEFLLMNNPLRDLIRERYEFPILTKMADCNETVGRILEIGCGRGEGTHLVKEHFRPARIEAVDLDERMIRIAQKSRNDSIRFRIMDASKLAYPDNSFDMIIDFGIIHHIPNWHDCILELARVSRDNGQLLLEELAIESFSGFPGIVLKKTLAHPYAQMFTFQEFENYLEEAGFRIIERKYANPMGLVKHISLAARINKA